MVIYLLAYIFRPKAIEKLSNFRKFIIEMEVNFLFAHFLSFPGV